MSENIFNRVFVTVGTTDFDALISVIDSQEFLDFLKTVKCERIEVQYGRGSTAPSFLNENCSRYGIEFNSFRFKDSLAECMASSSFIICHAGAGSITEALSMKKYVMVCVNDTLMDNHQLELANAVAEKGYCHTCFPSNLLETLATSDYRKIRPYDDIDYKAFPKFLDSILGT
mmetsp:Transcript_25370/g.37418  ORF Transcript_25370/g.37418 Transcript_25370/m.37418 type:complete len:173 (-) Transcript_25370:95-613(-)